MKIFLLISVMVAASAAAIPAQDKDPVRDKQLSFEPVDSAKVSVLDEVVVEGSDRYVTPAKSVYTPSRKEKEASYDAASLLMRMGLPEIIAIPGGSITTLSGKPVSIFINYQKASASDCEMLKTTDVRRVEYLTAPSDPRFNGAHYVVNFIVEEYLVGGYTKVFNVANTDYSHQFTNLLKLFNRFTFRKVTFDLLAGFSYYDVGKSGSSSHSVFRFPSSDGLYDIITRDQEVLDSKFIKKDIPVSLGINYKTDHLTFRNVFGYSFAQQPFARSGGLLTIDDGEKQLYPYHNHARSRENNFSWDGSLYLSMSGGWSLNLSNRLTHSHGNFSRLYDSGFGDLASLSGTHENAYNNTTVVSAGKTLPGNQSIRLVLMGKVNYNRIEYSGDFPAVEHLLSPCINGKLSYSVFTGKLQFSANAGMNWTGHRVNGLKEYRLSPDLFLFLNYMVNSKNILYLAGSYQYMAVSPSGVAPTGVRKNEFLYDWGNPDLKPYNQCSGQISYMWMPNSSFRFGLFDEYIGYFNRTVYRYFPMPGQDKALIKQLENRGNYHRNAIGLRAGYSLPGKLNLQVIPQITLYDVGGNPRRHYSPLGLTAWGFWYFGDFNAGFSFSTPQVSVPYDDYLYDKTLTHYSLIFGWTHKGLNVNLTFGNPFSGSYKRSDVKLDTEYYADRSVSYSPSYHSNVSLRLVYTFGYGSKIDNRDELDKVEGASSAVLKAE